MPLLSAVGTSHCGVLTLWGLPGHEAQVTEKFILTCYRVLSFSGPQFKVETCRFQLLTSSPRASNHLRNGLDDGHAVPLGIGPVSSHYFPCPGLPNRNKTKRVACPQVKMSLLTPPSNSHGHITCDNSTIC